MTLLARRRALAASVAIAVVMLLAGCAQAPQLSTKAPLTAANLSQVISAAEAKAGGVHLHVSTQVKNRTVVTIDADIAYSSRPTPMPTPSGPAKHAANPSSTSTSISASETITVAGKKTTTVNLILSGGATWVDLGGATGDRYVAAASAPSATVRAAKPYTTAADQANPLQLTQQLASAILFVQRSGPDTTLDGARVTPYLVEVNTTKAGDMLLGADAAATAVAGLPAQVDEDLWVGRDGLPYKESVISGDLDEEVSFSNWGKSEQIAPPPAAPVSNAAGSGTAGTT